jgi:hypothetical protein
MKPDEFARRVAQRTLEVAAAKYHVHLPEAAQKEIVAVATTPKRLNAILQEEPENVR